MNTCKNEHPPSIAKAMTLFSQNKVITNINYQRTKNERPITLDEYELVLRSSTNDKGPYCINNLLNSIQLRVWTLALNQRGGISNIHDIP